MKLIIGEKGSGKTKKLLEEIKHDDIVAKGNLVCIESGMKFIYQVPSNIKLINICDYNVDGYEIFLGFLKGILASNYDITNIYIDGLFRICGRDKELLKLLLTYLNNNSCFNNISFTITLSCEVDALGECPQQYVVTRNKDIERVVDKLKI